MKHPSLPLFAALGAMLPFAVLRADAPDPRVRTYVDPVAVVWTSPAVSYSQRQPVAHPEALLEGRVFSSTIPRRKVPCCALQTGAGRGAILLDFGRELHGGVQIGITPATPRGHRIRIRFGESAAEAMAELGEKAASNDHAVRDTDVTAANFGTIEFGNTGFRFVRIDLLTPGVLELETVRAVALERPMPRLGSFKCPDARLNRIWETAVRTAHLCCQDQLWDGIKRDRLVWMGDTHPETMTLLAAFGRADILPETLEHIAGFTPPDQWMNGMPTYTLWWLRNVYEWYHWTGDRAWLEKNAAYTKATLDTVLANRTPQGAWGYGRGSGWFLDHSSGKISAAGQKAGAQGLYLLALRDAKALMLALGDAARAAQCDAAMAKLRALPKLDPCGLKQAAAMLALSGLRNPKEMFAEALGRNGHAGTTTFMGYYMLEGMSAAGEHGAALRLIRDYWGGMLDVGATTFWEDFDLGWTNNAARIDRLPQPGQRDIHGDNGAGTCFVGYRHSFCHGWASGPCPWLMRHVLGVSIVADGGTAVEIAPWLGDLAWAEGDVPLARGVLHVRHERRADGTVKTTYRAPEGVSVNVVAR